MISHRLTCELADKIAAVGPVAGELIVPDRNLCQPERAVPVTHFHAIDHGVEPYYGSSTGELFFYRLSAPGFSSTRTLTLGR